MAETATTDKPAVTLDDFGKQAIEQATTLINQRNQKVGILQAAQGDPHGLLVALRESSDDPQVVKINEQIDKLNDQLLALETKRDELLKPQVEAMQADAKAQQESVTAEVDAIDAKVKSARNFIKQMYGEAALSLLPDMLGRKNRDGSASGEGSGKRVRGFDVYVDGNLATQRDGKGVERSNFSAAAKAAGVDTVALQHAFYEAQGSQDSKSWKDRVEFTVTDKDGKSHTVVAVRQPKDDEADDTSESAA